MCFWGSFTTQSSAQPWFPAARSYIDVCIFSCDRRVRDVRNEIMSGNWAAVTHEGSGGGQQSADCVWRQRQRRMWAHALPPRLPSPPPPVPRQSQTPDVRSAAWEVLLAPLRAEGRGKAREPEPRERTRCRNWHIPQRALGPLPSSPLAICSKKTLWNKNAALITLLGYGSTEQLLQRRGETGGGFGGGGGGGAPSKKEIPLSSRASESEGKNVLAKQSHEKHWANMKMRMNVAMREPFSTSPFQNKRARWICSEFVFLTANADFVVCFVCSSQQE